MEIERFIFDYYCSWIHSCLSLWLDLDILFFDIGLYSEGTTLTQIILGNIISVSTFVVRKFVEKTWNNLFRIIFLLNVRTANTTN